MEQYVQSVITRDLITGSAKIQDCTMSQLNVYYILGVQFRRHFGKEKVNF